MKDHRPFGAAGSATNADFRRLGALEAVCAGTSGRGPNASAGQSAPCGEGADERPTSRLGGPPQSGDHARPPLVLVADDNEDAREMFAEYMSFLGCEVLVAADGAEALGVALCSTPDLVMTDIAMPRLDGCDLIRSLRADEKTRGARIVALSGFGEAWGDAARAAGCDVFLAKPVLLADLDRVVESLLPALAGRFKG